MRPSVRPPVRQIVLPSVFLFVDSSVRLSSCLSVCPSVLLLVRQSGAHFGPEVLRQHRPGSEVEIADTAVRRAVPHSAAQRHAAQRSATPLSTAQRRSAQRYAVQHSRAAQRSAAQRSATPRSTTSRSAALQSQRLGKDLNCGGSRRRARRDRAQWNYLAKVFRDVRPS